jgi:hypothetical protein
VTVVLGDYKTPIDPANLAGGYSISFSSYTNYYPFGMMQPGRNANPTNYRFGFNGQEKTDEISGVGNHNTALYWEYDTRTGRRWNLDPKLQIYISDYACFSNSPIIKIDPYGDDDYYNESGKYVGTFGTGTAIRITTAKTSEMLKNWVDTYNLDLVNQNTKVVTVQKNVQETINKLYKMSNESSPRIERKSYIVLDVVNATLTIEIQPIAPGDNEDNCINIFDENTFVTKEKYINLVGDPTKVIVGQIHGQPDPVGSDATWSSKNLKAGVSLGLNKASDEKSANIMRVPVHAIDFTGKVSRIDQKGKLTNNVPQTEELLIKSLEISGGKPQNETPKK